MIRLSGGQGSHQLRSMALANALAILPNGEGAEVGDSVRVIIVAPEALKGGDVSM
jgi:molybdopterin biosynthesis enzyme